MKNLLNIKRIVTSILALCILEFAFFKNETLIKIIISPFIICSVAILFESIFDMLNKERISNIFKFIFRISFFIYVFVFLIYVLYYSIINKTYSLLIIDFIFFMFIIPIFKGAFKKK